MKCANCNKEIKEGDKYAVLWSGAGSIVFRFLCIPCSEKPEFKDITEEVQNEVP